MLDILKIHLAECFAVEEATLIEQAIEEMAKMNVDSDSFYSNLFMEWEAGLVDNLNQEIRAAVSIDATNVMVAHGITLSESASLSDILTLLRFINAFDDYDQPEVLLDIATNEEYGAVERFAVMVEEVTAECADNVMAMIEEITPYFAANAAEVLRKVIADKPIDISEEVESRELGKALEVYATKINGRDMQCYKHVHEAEAAVGLPLELYWKTYQTYLLSIPEKAMIYELIGFAMISDRSGDNPSDVIGPILSTYFGDDIDKIAMAKSQINQIVIDLHNDINSGVFVKRSE